MAKQRIINTKFWSDPWVLRVLNPLDRYLFLYFLTNEHTNISGIYELSIHTIAFDTGIEKDTLLKVMIPNLAPKVYYENEWVIMVNFTKHQNLENEKIRVGINRELQEIPDKVYEKAVSYGYPRLKSKEYIPEVKMSRRQSIYIRDRGICQYCEKEITKDADVEVDHIIPSSRGGADNYSNLILACRKCNQDKLDKTAVEYVGRNIEGRKYHTEQALKELNSDDILLNKVSYIYPTLIESTLSHLTKLNLTKLNTLSAKAETNKEVKKKPMKTWNEETGEWNDNRRKGKPKPNPLRAKAEDLLQAYYKGFLGTIVNDMEKVPRIPKEFYLKQAYGVLKIYSLEELKNLLPIFFGADFYKSTTWAISTFLSFKVLNSLKTEHDK